MNAKIWSRTESRFIDDEEELMRLSGLDYLMGFEDIGIQGDGTPVVFDKCGNFGYLDPQKFRFVVDLADV